MRRLPFIVAALFFALAGLIGPNHKHTAQASSAFYGFEDGTVQGWTHSGSATMVANSTTYAQQGSHSLQVSLSGASNSRTGFTYVNPGSGINAGDQLQAYVYLPSGSATLQAGIYVQDQAYKQTSANYVTLTAGRWTKLVYTVPSTAKLPLRQFGVQFTAPSRFTGSAFVDAAGVVTTPTNTATPTPTNTPAATATATPAPSACMSYTFEDGSIQGFSPSGSAQAVSNSTTEAYEGLHSLAVALSGASNSAAGFAYVQPPTCLAPGDTITAHVYAPSTGLTAALYVQDQGYHQTTANNVTVPANQWTTLTYTGPSTATTPIRQVGVQFEGASTWTGTAYVDLVETSTGATPTATATATTPTATPTATNTPAPTATSTPETVTVFRGVNLAGAEFGSNLPGIYGVDYTMPTTTELDYFHAKGLNLIRLPLKWERLQNAVNGPLSSNDIGLLDQFISDAHARGMYVIIDVHNYGRYYGNVIGTSAVPISAYADLWSKLAAHYEGMPGVWGYDIMNEPHDMNGVWPQAAQAAVNAIRQQDTQTRILVEGTGWASAYYWQTNNGSLSISDPNNNLIYEAHQYFDHDGSGTYSGTYDQEGAYPTVGVDRTKPFIDWLRANGHQGTMGEYGVPGNDSRWLTVLDNFLGYLDQNRDLGFSGADWAAGPWWGNYVLSIEPNADDSDKPQIPILTAHLGG